MGARLAATFLSISIAVGVAAPAGATCWHQPRTDVRLFDGSCRPAARFVEGEPVRFTATSTTEVCCAAGGPPVRCSGGGASAAVPLESLALTEVRGGHRSTVPVRAGVSEARCDGRAVWQLEAALTPGRYLLGAQASFVVMPREAPVATRLVVERGATAVVAASGPEGAVIAWSEAVDGGARLAVAGLGDDGAARWTARSATLPVAASTAPQQSPPPEVALARVGQAWLVAGAGHLAVVRDADRALRVLRPLVGRALLFDGLGDAALLVERAPGAVVDTTTIVSSDGRERAAPSAAVVAVSAAAPVDGGWLLFGPATGPSSWTSGALALDGTLVARASVPELGVGPVRARRVGRGVAVLTNDERWLFEDDGVPSGAPQRTPIDVGAPSREATVDVVGEDLVAAAIDPAPSALVLVERARQGARNVVRAVAADRAEALAITAPRRGRDEGAEVVVALLDAAGALRVARVTLPPPSLPAAPRCERGSLARLGADGALAPCPPPGPPVRGGANVTLATSVEGLRGAARGWMARRRRGGGRRRAGRGRRRWRRSRGRRRSPDGTRRVAADARRGRRQGDRDLVERQRSDDDDRRAGGACGGAREGGERPRGGRRERARARRRRRRGRDRARAAGARGRAADAGVVAARAGGARRRRARARGERDPRRRLG